MGTTTVGAINQQIDDARLKLGTPTNSGSGTGGGGLIDTLSRELNTIPPCWQVVIGAFILVGIYSSLAAITIPTGGLATLAVVLALGDEIVFGTIAGAGLISIGLSRMATSNPPPCWTN